MTGQEALAIPGRVGRHTTDLVARHTVVRAALVMQALAAQLTAGQAAQHMMAPADRLTVALVVLHMMDLEAQPTVVPVVPVTPAPVGLVIQVRAAALSVRTHVSNTVYSHCDDNYLNYW